MTAERDVLELIDPQATSRHRLRVDQLDAIAAGDLGGEAMAALVAAEYSRRLLLLRVLLGWAHRDVRPGEPLGSMDEAWALLERAQASDPVAVRQVLSDPHLGLWLSQTLRGWADEDEQTPRWVQVGYLGAVAASAAIRARIDFTITVPVRHGRVVLPDLGMALIPSETPWGTADIESRGGVVAIRGKVLVVTLPDDVESDAEQWHGLRKLHAEVAGQTLTIALNDLDPYQLTPGFAPANRLTAAEVQCWRELFEPAWQLLVRDHPDEARMLAAGMRSLVPLPPGGRFRPRSGSSGDAFGCALMSLPDDAPQLAVTLIHEFRHSTLSAVMHLVRLHEDDKAPLYAPWRDDPRPVAGLFQGVFSFLAVTEFWLRRCQVDRGALVRLAVFEFALWSRQTATALASVRDSSALTPLGRRFAERLALRIDGWQVEIAAGAADRDAGFRAARDHQACWGAHHRRIPADVVDAAVEAWLRGQAVPAAVRSMGSPVVRADPGAAWLDVIAILRRWQIADPEGFEQLRSGALSAEAVLGATEADIACVAGDFELADRLYLAEAGNEPDRPSAWARLAQVADSRGETHSAVALLEHPELVRAIQQGISGRSEQDVSPWAVAEWLGISLCLDGDDLVGAPTRTRRSASDTAPDNSIDGGKPMLKRMTAIRTAAASPRMTGATWVVVLTAGVVAGRPLGAWAAPVGLIIFAVASCLTVMLLRQILRDRRAQEAVGRNER